jgi:hypothetical protein
MASRLLAAALLAMALTGCVTTFLGSAPATSPRKQFVVGQKAGSATVWACPETGGDCQKVEIDE